MNAEGLNKAALLLMSIGESEAAEVFKYLGPREVQKIGATMATLKNVTREQLDNVMTEFVQEAEQHTALSLDSSEYIRAVLTKALGESKAGALIDRILQGSDTSGIEGLKWMDSAAVSELIKNEHPQIIATILVHLDRDQASEIVALMSERLRNDVLLRIATLDGIQPAALRELDDVLTTLLSGSDNLKRAPMGGIRTAAEILNFMSTAHEESVIENVKEFDAELAQKIIDQMFVFENLLELEDRAIQLLLKEVESETLIVSLKGAQPPLRQKFLANMSQRAAELLAEDLDSRGPVRLSEVEAQQRKILQIVRNLAESGQIQLGGKAEDAYVRRRRSRQEGSRYRRGQEGPHVRLPALGDGVVRSGSGRSQRRRSGRAGTALAACSR